LNEKTNIVEEYLLQVKESRLRRDRDDECVGRIQGENWGDLKQ